MEKQGSYVQIVAGGHREHDNLLVLCEESDFDAMIYNLSKSFSCHCTWLSEALLIHSRDKELGNKMVDDMKRYPQRYEWLYFFAKEGVPSFFSIMKSLTKTIQVQKSGFQMSKTAINMFDSKYTGCYLATLKDHVGQRTHVIGIDLDRNLIYDCMEYGSLSLTFKNLDKCCGKGHKFISFHHSCKIVWK
jgi:hypothetical protein